jgi:hypothetical protein
LQAVEDFRARFGTPVYNPLLRAWLWLKKRIRRETS